MGSAKVGADSSSHISVSLHPRFCRNWAKRWKPKTSSSSKARTTSSCSRLHQGPGKGGTGTPLHHPLVPLPPGVPLSPLGLWKSPQVLRDSPDLSLRCVALQNEGNKLYKDLKAFLGAVKGTARRPHKYAGKTLWAPRRSQEGVEHRCIFLPRIINDNNNNHNK